jgi:7,8-dihydropterin-6-yl-methyl-4-(beta-D-ribofuranosyl)aminobenzene 5'-phosphate synthase
MADVVKITVVVDNYVDIFLSAHEVTHYPAPGKCSQLLAEQGFSCWIETFDGGVHTTTLYDFGRSDRVLAHNAELLGLRFGQLDRLVLSHGHVDHYGSLYPVMAASPPHCPLFTHPQALDQTRYVKLRDGGLAGPWQIDSRIFEEFPSRLQTNRQKAILGNGIVLSGQIGRRTDFEPGMPNALVDDGGSLVHDTLDDDQALFIELAGKGLIIVTGCCHAGIVNTIEHAWTLFPDIHVHAVIGGLHLNSADDEQMDKTIEYLSGVHPDYIAACHCTGYHAARRLMRHFERSWIPITVGATMTFEGST